MASPAYPTMTASSQPATPKPQQLNMNAFKPFADAAYSQAASRLDPQFAQGEADFRQRMVSQGISEGNEAYDKAYANFQMGKNDAYAGARNDSLAQALAAQGQAFQQDAFGRTMDFNRERADMGDLMGLLNYGQSVTAQNNATLTSDQQRAMGLLSLIPGMSPMPINSQGAADSWLNQYNNDRNRASADKNARNAAYVQLASAFLGG